MGKTLTVRSPLLAASTPVPLTPAQRAVVWEICALLDEARMPHHVTNAVWLTASAARLRGPGARSDNWWLRECLERLLGVKFSGQDGNDPWGAVLLAEYRIERDVVRLLLPPSAVNALRLPHTFAKLDAEAAHRLPPNARTLYALIADKFRQHKPEWEIGLDDLKHALGMPAGRYGEFFDFRKRVLAPSTEAINQFGVCRLAWEPVKLGRSVRAVRFRWDLKAPLEAVATATENDRHSAARGKCALIAPDAPPLLVADHVTRWLAEQDNIARLKWRNRAVELGYTETPADLSPNNVNRWSGWVASELAEIEGLDL